MNHPEVVDRLAILNAAHPRRLSEGLHHPSQLRKSWYFFFFAAPGLPEDVVHARDWHFFRHFLQDANPPYTPRGNRTLRRGVVAAGRSGRDDQLLPRLGKTVPEGSRGKASPDLGADTRHLGGARFLPRLGPRRARTATTCPTSTAWSAWPTRRTGCITTRLNASTNCLSTSSPPRHRRQVVRNRTRTTNHGGRDEHHRPDRHRHPSLPRRHPRREARRAAPPDRRDAPALQGAGRRSVAGRAVGDDSGARALLGDRLRLAQGRGEAQRLAPVHDRDRRRGHPLHPRQVVGTRTRCR